MEHIEAIACLREFNRFYLTQMGFMRNTYLESEYSIAESRILFEIFDRNSCIQNDLVKALNIDKSYLSRMVKKLEMKDLIEKKTSELDRRAFVLTLTEKGEDCIRMLIEKSNTHISRELAHLNSNQYSTLCQALDTVISLLKTP